MEKYEYNFTVDKIEMLLDGKKIAKLTLVRKSNDEIDLIKLFVDPEMRGKGIAGIFMEKVATYFKNKTITPICSYAYSWYKKHPEYSVKFPEDGPVCSLK
ncbi:MAG: GNAT family N-acetyltransferase [Sphaerochaetaceae bacterium]|nr:GNAT family N-acetyltransferase [Sphaerochaetaceae bacterium]